MIKYVCNSMVWDGRKLTSFISPENTLEVITYNTLYDSIGELLDEVDIEWGTQEEKILYIIRVRIEPNYIKLEPIVIEATRKTSFDFEVIDDSF